MCPLAGRVYSCMSFFLMNVFVTSSSLNIINSLNSVPFPICSNQGENLYNIMDEIMEDVNKKYIVQGGYE